MKKLFTLLISVVILTGLSYGFVFSDNTGNNNSVLFQNEIYGPFISNSQSPNVVHGYVFSSSSGTYTALSTETILWSGSFDDQYSTSITIPSFTMDGTAYTNMFVTANGWIALGGSTIATSYYPISNSTAYPEVISGFGGDLVNATSGTPKISYNTNDGGDIVIQFQDVQHYGSSYNGSLLSFQIRLTPATGDIKIVYGGTIAGVATSITYQVGLRGATNADFNNRTTATDWSATTAGVLNTDACASSSTVLPTVGLTYKWVVPSGPPNPAVLVSPPDAGTGLPRNATLNWTAGSGGAPTGYKLYFGTDNPPKNIVNGTNLGLVNTYTPLSPLNYTVTYYWKIVPTNGSGDATGCPIWSFTVMADPTITGFPWTEGFESATFPPNAGWTNVKTAGTGTPGIWDRQTAGTSPTCTPHNGSVGMTRYNCYSLSAGTNGILVTPPITFPGNDYRVKFWFYRDAYSSYLSTADLVNVYYNTANNLTGATSLGTVNRSIALAPVVATEGWYEYSFNMPAGATGSGRYIIFEAVSAFGDNIFLDDFTIEQLPPTPAFAIAPTSKDFGNCNTGGSTANQTFTISNASGGALTVPVGGVTLTGADASQFTLTITTALPWSLTGTSTATVDVKFSPTSTGLKNATLQITDNAPGSPHTAALTGTGVASSSIPWTEEFSTWPPPGFTLTGGTQSWAQYTTTAAFCDFWGWSAGQTAVMITPFINLGAASFPILEFRWSHLYSSSYPLDELQVSVSSNGGATWTVVWDKAGATLESADGAGNTTPGTYVSSGNISLASFVGQTIIVKFNGISGFGPDVFVDEVTVKEPAPNDVGTFSVDVLPNIAVGTTAPMATVKNYGTATQTFPVTMTITGGYSSTQTVTSLAPGATAPVTFANWTPVVGSYIVHVATQLAGDANPANDTLSKNVAVWPAIFSSGATFPSTVYLGSGVGYTDISAKTTTGYLFSIGGLTISNTVSESYKYNANTNTWSMIATMPSGTNGRRNAATAIVGTSLYAIGGTDISDVDHPDVYKYDIPTDAWTTVAPLAVTNSWGKAVARNNLIYLVGGIESGLSASTVHVYDVVANTWTTATSLPLARMGGALSIVGNQLIYVGGSDDVGAVNTVYVGTIDSGNPLLITWAAAADYPGIPNRITFANTSVQHPYDIKALDNTKKTKTSKTIGKSGKGDDLDVTYPPGLMYRFDGAPWGSDGIIVANGSPSWTWAPANPCPCYVYIPSTNTWIQQANLPVPVTAASLGTCQVPGGLEKLIVAGGMGTNDNEVQILTHSLASPLNLGLTAMLSGYCNGTTMNYTKSVTVELHASGTPHGLIESQAVTLSTSGTANPIFTLATNGTPYYIVIKSNNGLETWSATPQTFTGSTLNYDFTTAATQAYGSNELLVGTKWCIISGDADQNGTINAVDRSLCWNDRNLVGVYATDFDGNGTVNALDRSIAWNNRNLSVAKPALVLSPERGAKQDNKVTNDNTTKGKTFDLRLDGSNAKKVTKTK